ncbi:MAG: Flp pilus assembly complex ATPase component TadA [Planctomycetales bacterium]|nr:Flp pilus assembly complex ATPase component TadA [Planctomycetales bacterium]
MKLEQRFRTHSSPSSRSAAMPDSPEKPSCDQWYFEIGDGNTYGPFSLEKLQKWAALGNLMPTHRVRNADSSEWTIAAYVPGLESTTKATVDDDEEVVEKPTSKGIGGFVRGLGGKKGAAAEGGDKSQARVVHNLEPPDIVALCDELLESAFVRGASDLHLDPEDDIVLVDIRVDGELETLRKFPKNLHGPLVGRYKVLAKMDIAERRAPQDGQFVYPLGPNKKRVSIRAACLPTTHGERLTLRLLAVETEELTLKRIGMSKEALEVFAKYVGHRQGMILVTGPTGSGKSTTLYAALRHRLAHQPGRIITVEDPVEFDIVGVAQAEVDSTDRVRFATVLRNILRSDPDVVMIGEIRDRESADIAIKAALTGHLVLSTLHTKSAAGAFTRLIDIGIEPYQVASTLHLSVAQRLIRRLCTHCRKPRQLTHAEADLLGISDAAGKTVYDPVGCKQCRGRGYQGRVGLFELIPIDESISRKIINSCDEEEIARYAREQGHPSLKQDGVYKLLAGAISLQDLIVATSE